MWYFILDYERDRNDVERCFLTYYGFIKIDAHVYRLNIRHLNNIRSGALPLTAN